MWRPARKKSGPRRAAAQSGAQAFKARVQPANSLDGVSHGPTRASRARGWGRRARRQDLGGGGPNGQRAGEGAVGGVEGERAGGSGHHGPPGRLWPMLCATGALAGAVLWGLAGAPAVGAQAPAVPLTAAEVSALHGHLQTWQVLWLESGGASGVLPGPAAAAPEAPDPRNAAYLLNGSTVTLSNGTATGPLTPGSAYVVTTWVVGPSVHGQLAGDGLVDTATVLAQGWADGGTAEYVAALLAGSKAGPAPTARLGDDVGVGWLRVLPGEILADTVAALPGGPAGRERVQAFRLENGALVPSAAPLRTLQAAWTASPFHPVVTEDGTCPSASRVADRAGAYRCSVSGATFDPCFALPAEPSVVACPQGDPAAHSGVEIELSAAPPDVPAAGGVAAPWSFVLMGGGVCDAAARQAAFPGHPYACSLPGTAALFCAAPHRVNPDLYTTECARPASASGVETLGADVPYVIDALWF